LNTLSSSVNYFPILSGIVCRYEKIPFVWRWKRKYPWLALP
jgi:hypothetical protein